MIVGNEATYELARPHIGRGEFARIYYGRNVNTGEIVAVKRLHNLHSEDLTNEYNAGKINSPYLRKSYDIFNSIHDGLDHRFIVLEYLKYGNLA